MERVYQVVKVLCRETIRPCVKQVGYCVTEDNTKDQDSFHVVKVMIPLLLCAHFSSQSVAFVGSCLDIG